MASTRKPKRAERAACDLLPRLRAQLAGIAPTGSRILVALSGGVDSIVLLDLMRRLATRRRWQLSALHVNHQLQEQAGEWARFCRRICRDAGIPLKVVKADVAPGNSLERAARAARYAIFAEQDVDYVALAHNQDDQAETVLLHLFRGSGIRGMAGMRIESGVPVPGCGDRPKILRPLLDLPRSELATYAEQRRLKWIDDPSNANTRFTRNFLRAEVLPRVAERFPRYREALARAAAHAAEAAELLDELAMQDAARDANDKGLSLARLRALSPARAKNVLRHFLQSRALEIPSADRLEEALRQVLTAGRDAGVRIRMGVMELRVHAGTLVLAPHRDREPAVERVWTGEKLIMLPELGGTLRMERRRGTGISRARLDAGPVTIHGRRGGERLRPYADGMRRTVKNLMQEAGMPAWERDRVPYIYCGSELVCVPGIGIDSAYCAAPRESSVVPVWETT